jgi:hypothetical protein
MAKKTYTLQQIHDHGMTSLVGSIHAFLAGTTIRDSTRESTKQKELDMNAELPR